MPDHCFVSKGVGLTPVSQEPIDRNVVYRSTLNSQTLQDTLEPAGSLVSTASKHQARGPWTNRKEAGFRAFLVTDPDHVIVVELRWTFISRDYSLERQVETGGPTLVHSQTMIVHRESGMIVPGPPLDISRKGAGQVDVRFK
jgi:hypothetical protein